MAKGEYQLAEQSGARGYFGRVVLNVESTETDEIKVDFDERGATRWQNAACFGIDYVIDRIPRRKFFPRGGRVHVTSIEGHEVDTNGVIVAYVAAHALLNALDIQLANPPHLDTESGEVVFSK